MSKNSGKSLLNVFIVLTSLWLLIGAGTELYQISWGTGVWFGQFAPTWFVLFAVYILFSIMGFIVLVRFLQQPELFDRVFNFLSVVRNKIRTLRWFVFILLLFLPGYILQYTFWGVVLDGPYLRIMLVTLVSIVVAWLLTTHNGRTIDWTSLLVTLVLISGAISALSPFGRVTNYPFSLGWSEGNRFWDYSIKFGRDVYNYPADKPIPVLLDRGRQLVGGLPFLISGLTISQARLWLAILDVLPYLVLAWIAFQQGKSDRTGWLLTGIWAFTFVRQGPIHVPLLICATLVALAWKRPLWLAMPMIFIAGYFAEFSRFTWLFAPAMWAVMLEFASATQLNKGVWRRTISVGIAGVLGGFVVPYYLQTFLIWIKMISQSQTSGGGVTGSGVLLASAQTGLTSQPLLWSRLLPNETYGPGILAGLILAAAPLILVLIYLVTSTHWQLNAWQKASVILPLLAFLIVGLIVSVKIGGGGDLHNLDMFIIGLMFAAAIAWKKGGYEWITQHGSMPLWVRLSLLAAIIVPVLGPLYQMRPLAIGEDRQKVATLADITTDPLPNPLPDTIPSEHDTQKALRSIQRAVQDAAGSGDVLFMDQRQLLTFGYIQDVPLVPEYDKKMLIDKAMASDSKYFEIFYRDIAAHRFALIITSPVNRRLDDEEGNFGEENNAWVKWVTKPLLCYYQPLDTLKTVGVELLIPRTGDLDCISELPQ